jgi:DNA integrity scanning protein DisA with diadenylate cyclase activity
MHNSFSREQQYISRITELEQMVFNLNQDIDTLDRYRSELQQTCEEMGYSLETLKDTNEKLYTEATSLSVQKSELEEKLICRERALSRI